MPPDTVTVARPSRWGNPFSVQQFGDLAVPLFEAMLLGQDSVALLGQNAGAEAPDVKRLAAAWRQRLGGDPMSLAKTRLEGKHLACWCALGVPCHADVLLRLANAS